MHKLGTQSQIIKRLNSPTSSDDQSAFLRQILIQADIKLIHTIYIRNVTDK